MGKQEQFWRSQHGMASETKYTFVLAHCKTVARGLSASTNLLKTGFHIISRAFSLRTAPAQIHNSLCIACSFLWTVQYLVGAGFYVIPAYQPADHSVDNTVVSTPAIFLRNWANLWTAISELPNFDTS